MLLWYVSKLLPNYTLSHPRRQYTSSDSRSAQQDLNCGILGLDTIYFCRWLLMFRKPVVSILEVEVRTAGKWKSYVKTVEGSRQEGRSIRALDGEEAKPCLNQWEGQPSSTHFTLKTEIATSSET